MNEIRKLQMILLNIAKDIKTICDNNGINYYIHGGTMLGAVRHGGFIPWDDDLDIAMKREDFEKFLLVCETELDKAKYFIQNSTTENKYCFDFCKIRLLGTTYREDFSWNVDINHGIFVDIFPLDNIPDNKIMRKIFLFKNQIFKNLIWVKCGYGNDKNKSRISYKVFKFMSFFLELSFLQKLRYNNIMKYRHRSTKFLFSSDYPNEIYDKTLFNEKEKYNFEKTQFYGVKDYDKYLKMLYGDYMKLPPKRDRKIHTKYKIDFGKY